MSDLVVVSPFASYARGTRITDAATIAALLASSNRPFVVAVLDGVETVQPDPPAPADPSSATSGDYGFIAYSALASEPALTIPAGQRTRLTFPIDPAATIDRLKGPFAGHAFWDGAKVLPRAVDDNAEIRLIISVNAFVLGGHVLADIDIGGAFGAFETDDRMLSAPAGTDQTIRFLFVDYMRSTFLANGGALYLTPSVPITVRNESLVVYPRGAGS